MPRMARLRVPRSLAVAAVIVALAVGAHTVGGGILPAPSILLGLGALTLVPVAVLSSRRLSVGTLALTVGAGQVVLHRALTVLSPAAVCLPVGHPAGGTHLHVTSLMCRLPESPAAAHGPLDSSDVAMAAAHALATAATVLLLAKSEEALWLLAAWLRPLITGLRPADMPVVNLHRQIRGPVFRPLNRIAPRVHGRRGPPVSLPAPHPF
jgi:hypothetical protein